MKEKTAMMGLGEAIEAVLKGEVKRASRITEEQDELIMENRGGNLWIGLKEKFEMLALKADLHERDVEVVWTAEYGEDLQPFEIMSVRYVKLQGGTTRNEITHEYRTTLAKVKAEYEAQAEFRGFLSIVGFNGGKVTVLLGEEDR